MSIITSKPSGKGFSGVKSKFVYPFLGLMLLFIFSIPSVSASDGLSSDPVNLNVFIIIGAFSLFLLVIGLGANIPFFTIVGFFLVAVMGWIVFNGSLLVPTGVDEYSYSNVSGVPVVSSVEAVNVAWNTGNYRFIGFFIMMIGIFATFFSVFAVFGGGDN